MFQPNCITYASIYTIGFVVRLIFLHSVSLTKYLENRVEIASPITSWKRAVEGVTLRKQGINPYDGDIFHESPLALITYEYVLTYFKSWIPAIFSLSDVFTAAALSLTAYVYLKSIRKKEGCPSNFHSTAEPVLIKETHVQWAPFYISAVYLLSPYSVVSCGGKSTAVFFNFFVSLFLLLSVSGFWPVASVVLAFTSYHSFYHLNLLVPFLIFLHMQSSSQEEKYMLRIVKIVGSLILFISTVALLVHYSHQITKSWSFLWSTYGCILSVPDLTPNIGLFWYFFTEMFEHFRVFFLWTFQINVFVYTVPLAIRLRKEPIFLILIHLIIIAIFKSYPCIGDIAFYMALLPIWSHLFCFMRQRFIVCCGLASCTLLAPTLWYLWIYSGSANANFYFAITLVFNTGQVFLLTDLLSAFIKREYYLENGIKYNEDGSLALMRLK